MKITILGAGAIASALVMPLTDRGHEVKLWFTEYDMFIYEKVSRREPHPRTKIVLPSNIKLYKPKELDKALSNTDVIVIAVSSRGVLPISKMIKETISTPKAPLVVVAKGLEVIDDKVMTMTEIVSKYTGSNDVIYVGGPSLAIELANKRPTYVVYASRKIDLVDHIAREFQTNYYKITTTDDVIGLELSAALKNIYAMAYGIVEGYLESHKIINKNLKAAVLSRSIEEIASIVSLCGGRKDTVYGLGGLGDLYVTALGGRNSMFGNLLGRGLSVGEALKEMERRGVGVVEGYRNAETIKKFLVEKNIPSDKTPIFNAVHGILYENKPIETLFDFI